jgi:hypothetical protein
MSVRALAAAFLAVGFAAVSYVAIAAEPGMGFTTPGDFLDPVKVATGYQSGVWRVENLFYLGFPVALWILALPCPERLQRWSGALAGLFFLVVGAIDRVGIQLPFLLTDERSVQASVAALLPIRFALMKCVVLTICIFAWRTTRNAPASGAMSRLWRAYGSVMAFVGVAFVFVFIPAPVAILVWAVGLTAAEWRRPATS